MASQNSPLELPGAGAQWGGERGLLLSGLLGHCTAADNPGGDSAAGGV